MFGVWLYQKNSLDSGLLECTKIPLLCCILGLLVCYFIQRCFAEQVWQYRKWELPIIRMADSGASQDSDIQLLT